MNNTIKNLRSEIDEVDENLLNNLAKRQQIVKKIGKIKKEAGIKQLDNKRWQKLMENRLAKAKKLGLSENLVKNLYQIIHKNSLEIEEKT